MGLPYGEKFHNLNFNRFCIIHPCDGQTDGRAIAYSMLSIYTICCRALKTVAIRKKIATVPRNDECRL